MTNKEIKDEFVDINKKIDNLDRKVWMILIALTLFFAEKAPGLVKEVLAMGVK